MAQVARRHHTVPKFYLEGFARNGRIGTVRLPGDSRFVQTTQNAAAQTDFYSIPGHEEGADVFEKGLSELEGQAAKVFSKILGDHVWPLSQEDRGILATFITVQYLRGPDHRRSLEQTAALFAQVEIGFGGRERVVSWAKRTRGLDLTEKEADQVWADATQPGGPPIRLAPAAHIKQLLDTVPMVIKYFAGRPWCLIRFEKKRLLTSDAPLALIPDLNADTNLYLGVGLMTAWGITFPMDRRTGLILANPEPLMGHVTGPEVANGGYDTELTPTASHARLFNDSTIGNAREWIYHHPEDDDLIPADLPEPHLVEVAADIPHFGAAAAREEGD